MTADPPRPDDPYSLLGGTPDKWPPLVANDYTKAAADWAQHVNGYTHGGNQTSMEAARAADNWFEGSAHDVYIAQLQLDRSELQKHATNAQFIQSTLTAAGGKVTAAKTSIAASVEHWNTQIDAAKGMEMGGYRPDPSSDDLISQAKQEIRDLYAEYKNEMEIVGNQLEAGTGETAGSTGTEGPSGKPGTEETPGKPAPPVDPKNDTGGPFTPNPDPTDPGLYDPSTGKTTPIGTGTPDTGNSGAETPPYSSFSGSGTPAGGDFSGGDLPGGDMSGGDVPGGDGGSPPEAAPAAGMPSAGGGMPQMPQQMPQMPQQMPGQDLAGKGMDDLKDMVTGKGDQDGVPIDDDTLRDLLDAQDSDDTVGDEDESTTRTTTENSSGPAEPTSAPPHGATVSHDNGPSPASPVVSTPGHTMPGSAAPVTELSGTHGGGANSFSEGPATELAGSHGGSGMPGAPASSTGGAPGGGGPDMAGGSTAGGTGTPTAGRHHSGQSPGLERKESTESKTTAPRHAATERSGFPGPAETYLDDLPPEHAAGHRVLASLTDQFRRVRWPATPIAVGVFASSIVFTTADAVSIWPFGVRIPEKVLPLNRVNGCGEESFVGWFGVNRPAEKIIRNAATVAAVAGDLEAVIINAAAAKAAGNDHQGLVTVQTQKQLEEILAADASAAVSVPRSSLSNIPPDAVQTILPQLGTAVPDSSAMDGTDPDTELRRRAASLWALRKADQFDDFEYLASLIGYLLAEAHLAAGAGNVGDAGYSVTEILSLTNRLTAAART